MSGGRLYCLVPLLELAADNGALGSGGTSFTCARPGDALCDTPAHSVYSCYPSSLLSADFKSDVLIQAVHPLHSCFVSDHYISSTCAERLQTMLRRDSTGIIHNLLQLPDTTVVYFFFFLMWK